MVWGRLRQWCALSSAGRFDSVAVVLRISMKMKKLKKKKLDDVDGYCDGDVPLWKI